MNTTINTRHNKQNKGVSLLFKQLPFTLKFVTLYPVISNSKAA
jgi:hypothetical protein